MIVTDKQQLIALLSHPGLRKEAESIVEDTRAEHGLEPKFAMMRYSSDDKGAKGWILVTQQTARMWTRELNRNGLTRSQMQKLFKEIDDLASKPNLRLPDTAKADLMKLAPRYAEVHISPKSEPPKPVIKPIKPMADFTPRVVEPPLQPKNAFVAPAKPKPAPAPQAKQEQRPEPPRQQPAPAEPKRKYTQEYALELLRQRRMANAGQNHRS